MHSNQNECQEEESKGVPSQEPRVDLPADVDIDEEVLDTHQSQAEQVPGDEQQQLEEQWEYLQRELSQLRERMDAVNGQNNDAILGSFQAAKDASRPDMQKKITHEKVENLK